MCAMSFHSDALPAGELPLVDPDLHLALVEHLMRITNDDTLVLKVLAAPSLVHLRATLGAVLPALHASPAPTTPFAVALGYGTLDPSWRSKVATCDPSLWSELELMRTLGATSSASDPLLELLDARS